MDDIFVTMADLPCSIGAFVVANNDMTYTIVLNSRLSHEKNIASYWHEIAHIRRGDYDKKCQADVIEITAHKG